MKFSIPTNCFRNLPNFPTLDISWINRTTSKWKIREDPPTITKKRSQLTGFHRDRTTRFPLIHADFCRSIRKTVRLVCAQSHALGGSTAKTVSPWRPVSGVLEQHATGTVHHLGNEHRRAGAEPSISLLILVLVVFAVEIAALWKKHVFFHRATRSKQFLKLKMCNGENVRNLLNKRVSSFK